MGIFDTMDRERVVSGAKPTGELHLGNLLGATRVWVDLQSSFECFFFVADLHALTEPWDPLALRWQTQQLAGDLLAAGIDPERSLLFVQSHVPAHTELAWVFDALTSYGDLHRMTQFKEKRDRARVEGEFVSAGLFDYPVLQAADILAYRGARVPVGQDQLQHLELTRRIARRFNVQFGVFFPEPEPILSETPRVMSLADPARKMSKSLGPEHTIGIMEEEQSIWKKVRAAVTDVGPRSKEEAMSPGVANLFQLLQASAPASVVERFLDEWRSGVLKYEPLKRAVFEHLMMLLGPIRERRCRISNEQIEAVLALGAQRATTEAEATLREVRHRVGIGPTHPNSV
jgi:tryptophanyl-tRNA synthetase